MANKTKQIRCSWRQDAGKFQICYDWAPNKWILTSFSNREHDRERAILWAKENEALHKNTGKKEYPTFQKIAEGFFDIGGPYFQSKEQKGKKYRAAFYRMKRGFLNNHIMPYFKRFKINEINTFICEEFSLSLKNLSADTKNKVIYALKEILKPWVGKGVLSYNPVCDVERFHVEPEEREPFTGEELALLYPATIQEGVAIWGSLQYFAWGLVLRDTGCRPSEAIAWKWDDYSEKWGGFPIVRHIYEGVVIEGTKGGKRRFRAAILSERGNEAIKRLRRTATEERVFPFTTPCGLYHFRLALARAGIPERGRTQYCLRHTAVTQTIDIDRDFAREAFGHSTVKVQEGYDHPDIDQLFQRVSKASEILRRRAPVSMEAWNAPAAAGLSEAAARED